MSRHASGSFATRRLWEAAPGGDASRRGSWVVPEGRHGLESRTS